MLGNLHAGPALLAQQTVDHAHHIGLGQLQSWYRCVRDNQASFFLFPDHGIAKRHHAAKPDTFSGPVVDGLTHTLKLTVSGKACRGRKDVEHELAGRRREVELFGETLHGDTELIEAMGGVKNVARVPAKSVNLVDQDQRELPVCSIVEEALARWTLGQGNGA